MASRTSSRKCKSSEKAIENEETEKELQHQGIAGYINDCDPTTNVISPPSSSQIKKKQKQRIPNVILQTIKYFRHFGVDYEKEKRNGRVPNLTKTFNESCWRCRNLGQFFYKFQLKIISFFNEANQLFLLQNIKSRIEQEINERSSTYDDQFYHDLIKTIVTAYSKSPIYSPQYRALRSVFVEALPRAELIRLEQQYNMSLGSTGSSRTSGQNDYKIMVSGEELVRNKYSRCVKTEAVLWFVVTFILAWDNCQHVYWKTRKIVLSPTEIYEIFPRLMRKISMQRMWAEYQKVTEHMTKKEKVGRTLYIDIAGTITYNDPVIIQAVDYVTAELVTDVVESFQEIWEKMIKPGETFDKLEKMLTLTRHFLKNQYKLYTTKENDNNDCFYGLDYALNTRVDDNESESTTPRTSTCQACKFPFYVADSIIRKVKSNKLNRSEKMVDSAVEALEDGKEKFLQYMKHVARCRAQQLQLEKTMKEMEEDCINTDGNSTRAHGIMDYKMKWEICARSESSKHHFGKRTISWHGVLIMYYKMVNFTT